MRIGIAYDLKVDAPASADLPDDFQEEFDSPATIEAIASVLRRLGHDVVKLGDGPEFLKRVLTDPPDFVFNFAEGQGVGRCREARVPAVLEMLGIPYTGSDPLTLSVTLDKECAKRLASACGVKTVRGIVIEPDQDPLASARALDFGFPAIAKPAWEGSSKGIRGQCLVHSLEEIPSVITALRRDHQQPILLEEFVPGDELTVAVIGNRQPEILGVMRILPRQATERFVYSLEVKRDFRRQVQYECPARIDDWSYRQTEEAALAAYRALGCRDISRLDFRLDREGCPIFLEANPLPGLNPESSDLVILAELVGWTFDQLVEAILQAARVRCGETATTAAVGV